MIKLLVSGKTDHCNQRLFMNETRSQNGNLQKCKAYKNIEIVTVTTSYPAFTRFTVPAVGHVHCHIR